MKTSMGSDNYRQTQDHIVGRKQSIEPERVKNSSWQEAGQLATRKRSREIDPKTILNNRHHLNSDALSNQPGCLRSSKERQAEEEVGKYVTKVRRLKIYITELPKHIGKGKKRFPVTLSTEYLRGEDRNTLSFCINKIPQINFIFRNE